MGALTTTAMIALTVANTVRQANQAKGQAGYASGIAGQNAQLAEMQADDVLARGRETENRYRADAKRFGGTQRVRLASQGIDMGSGSALDVQLEADAMSELDLLTIRNNARRDAFGYRTQGAQYQEQAKAIKKAGKSAYGNTLLTGAIQVGGIGYQSGWFGSR